MKPRLTKEQKEARAQKYAREDAIARKKNMAFLVSAYKVAIQNGWTEMAERYAARIEIEEAQS
jgi:hypothetical protein